jgi:DNA (cytosine-5)-methyltransferase 1
MHGRVGSLATGYDGLGMALGGESAWFAENDPAASKVLAHHWPDVPNLGDIKTVDWKNVEPVDWLTAGYPCQNWSLAGKRKGVDDPRHIWPDIAEAIRVVAPRYVLLENVRGHLSLGFNVVLGSLADLGYDATWHVVRASDAGAPHKRERVFVFASYADGERVDRGGPRSRWWQEPAHRGNATSDADATRLEDGCLEHDGGELATAERGSRATAADPDGLGTQGRLAADRPDPQRPGETAVGLPGVGPGGSRLDWGAYEPAVRRWERILGREAPDPTEPGVRTDRRLSAVFVEWMLGLPEGHVTGVPGLSRTHQLKILGNGVVVQQCQLALSLLTAPDYARKATE